MKKKPALKSQRISVRLTKQTNQCLKQLAKVSESDISDEVMLAIMERYNRIMGLQGNALQIFTETGFIGSGTGPADLSLNYKQYLTEGLVKKHDLS